MSFADQGAERVRPADVERWLDELGVRPDARTDREGVTSWDLRLDGRRRFDVPITLILDPTLALIVWVHFAPPIGDGFRKSYRRLLRWNDEFPFAKFSLAEDERPILTFELPIATVDREELGLAVARSLAIADRLLEESAGWLWIGGRIPDSAGRFSRGAPLLDRFAAGLGELDAGVAGGATETSGEAAETADSADAGDSAATPTTSLAGVAVDR
jgi:hypothetical protein